MFGKKIKVWSQHTGYVEPKQESDVQEIVFINNGGNEDPVFDKENGGFIVRAFITDYDEDSKFVKKDNSFTLSIKSLERKLIHTGLYFKMPENTELVVRPDNNLLLYDGLNVTGYMFPNIFSDSKELCVIATNLSDKKLTIKSGDNIGYCQLLPVYSSKENINFIKINLKEDVIK